jgi:hypothetical protein
VGVLQDPNEVALVQTLAVSAEQITCCNSSLTGADRRAAVAADGAANQIERFLATEPEPTGSDFIASRWSLRARCFRRARFRSA